MKTCLIVSVMLLSAHLMLDLEVHRAGSWERKVGESKSKLIISDSNMSSCLA